MTPKYMKRRRKKRKINDVEYFLIFFLFSESIVSLSFDIFIH